MTKAAIPSPIGLILLESDRERLLSARILAQGQVPPDDCGTFTGSPVIAEAAAQIAAYFDKRLDDFDLPLAPAASPRGETLRAAIAAIPAGATLSYGALARIAQSGPRAIGQACARNIFPLIIPCHRVVGSGGSIGHYSGANGITTKRWLLDHERRGGLI